MGSLDHMPSQTSVDQRHSCPKWLLAPHALLPPVETEDKLGPVPEGGADAGQEDATDAYDPGQLQKGQALVWDWEANPGLPVARQGLLHPGLAAGAERRLKMEPVGSLLLREAAGWSEHEHTGNSGCYE